MSMLTESAVQSMDERSEIQPLRDAFIIPKDNNGEDKVYLCGNSLGLQPVETKAMVNQILDEWATFGVQGHFKSEIPWYSYHESLRHPISRIVGAKEEEVVAMNSLTTNLHLLMVSFYRPTKEKYKIMIEADAFPSDRYAVMSQLKFHGVEIEDGLCEIAPLEGESTLTTQQILDVIEAEGDKTALVLLSGVQYLTGQVFDMEAITKKAQQKGCLVGFDLAHAVGNVVLKLHDWQVDFACWCTYKYLNAGPGGVAGAFVHERHLDDASLNRFAGWWGVDPLERFKMSHDFVPVKRADAWQLSNPPILQMASLKSSLNLFNKTSIAKLRKKGDELVDFIIEHLTTYLKDKVKIITPKEPKSRGNQLSLRILNKDAKGVCEALAKANIICDFRQPDVLRFAVAPMYNNFHDCYRFIDTFRGILDE